MLAVLVFVNAAGSKACGVRVMKGDLSGVVLLLG